MEIVFRKVHGSKNDFFLIDEEEQSYQFIDEEREKLAQILCNRESGIGADGILFLSKSEHADGKMRIFNSDGSEASMCGNGLRCAGRYLIEKSGKENIFVETKKAILEVQKYQDENEEGVPFFQVEISPIRFTPESLPMKTTKEKIINEKLPYLSDELLFTAVAVPNPHLIAIVSKEQILSAEQERIATMVNQPNPYFPDGVNVSFVYPLGDGEIFVKTYERGVGFTNACGTAMSASSLVTILNGLFKKNQTIRVYNNGGYVYTKLNDHMDKIYLIGNGTYEFAGIVQIEGKEERISHWHITKEYTDEQKGYQKIEKKAKEKLKEVFGKEAV